MAENVVPKINYRGIAVVIGIEIFDTKPGQRNINRGPGCLNDIKIMKMMLEKLDFFVMCYKDLTANQMREKIRNASQHPMNAESEYFVLALSTHGSETQDKWTRLWSHEVMGSDRNTVPVDEILNMFDKNKAPSLKNKPKMFFFQACRSKDRPQHEVVPGEQDDEGVVSNLPLPTIGNIKIQDNSIHQQMELPWFNEDNFTGCDNLYTGQNWNMDPDCWNFKPKGLSGVQCSDAGPEGDTQCAQGRDTGAGADSNKLPQQPVDVLKITCPEDCLIYYPVVSGKDSFRYPYGSLLMLCMKKEFPKLLQGYTLTNYLKFVNKAMADEVVRDKSTRTGLEADLKVTANFVHRMSERVIFEPKSPNSPMAIAKKMMELHVKKVKSS